jgi:hypothetical protein
MTPPPLKSLLVIVCLVLLLLVSIILSIVFTRSSGQDSSAHKPENQGLNEELLRTNSDNEAIDAKDLKLSVAEKDIQDLKDDITQNLQDSELNKESLENLSKERDSANKEKNEPNQNGTDAFQEIAPIIQKEKTDCQLRDIATKNGSEMAEQIDEKQLALELKEKDILEKATTLEESQKLKSETEGLQDSIKNLEKDPPTDLKFHILEKDKAIQETNKLEESQGLRENEIETNTASLEQSQKIQSEVKVVKRDTQSILFEIQEQFLSNFRNHSDKFHKVDHFSVVETDPVDFLSAMELMGDCFFIAFWDSYRVDLWANQSYWPSKARDAASLFNEVNQMGKGNELFVNMIRNYKMYLDRVVLNYQGDKDQLITLAMSLYYGKFRSIWRKLGITNSEEFQCSMYFCYTKKQSAKIYIHLWNLNFQNYLRVFMEMTERRLKLMRPGLFPWCNRCSIMNWG